MREVLADLATRYPGLGAPDPGRAARASRRSSTSTSTTRTSARCRGSTPRCEDGSIGDPLPAMAGGEAPVTRLSARRRGSRPARPRREHAARRAAAGSRRTRTCKLYAKLEGQNPTGSIKDRVAQSMIEDAEAARRARAGPRAARADHRQHRHLAGDGREAQGLQARPASCPRTSRPSASSCSSSTAPRSSSPRPRKARTARSRLALRMAEARPALLHALPVRQRGQPARPLRGHRRRDRGRDCPESTPSSPGSAPAARSWAPGDRLKESVPGPPGRRRGRAAAGRPRQRPALARRRLRPADPRRRPSSTGSCSSPTEDSVDGPAPAARGRAIFAGVSSGAVIHTARRIASELDAGVVVAVLSDGGWKYLSADFWTRPAAEVGRGHGRPPLVVIPAEVRSALVEHAAGGAPERGLRPDRAPRRRRRALLPRPERAPPARTASSSRSTPRSGSWRTTATSSPSSTRTRLEPAAAVAHRRRDHRALGGQAVRDPLAPQRRAGRLDDPGRAHRAASARALTEASTRHV